MNINRYGAPQNKSLPGNSWLSSASSSSLSIGGSRADTGAPALSIVSDGIRWLNGKRDLDAPDPAPSVVRSPAWEARPDEVGEYGSWWAWCSEGEWSTSNGSGVGSRTGGEGWEKRVW